MRKGRQSRRRRAGRPTKVKARAKKYFAAVASRWDRMREDFFDETVADSILKTSDLEKHNERWLRKEMADKWLGFDLTKVEKWFEDAGLADVKVELARTKCCGISLHGRKAEIGIFIASGSKQKGSLTL